MKKWNLSKDGFFFFFFPLFESDVIYVRKEISIGVYWEKELFKGHKKGMGKSFTG